MKTNDLAISLYNNSQQSVLTNADFYTKSRIFTFMTSINLPLKGSIIHTIMKEIGFLKKILFSIILLCFSFTSFSQSDDLILDNHIYYENVKTPMVYPKGNILGDPYLKLNGGSLIFRFDDLSADYKDLYYSAVHCDSNWELSDLDKSDYLEGFYSNSITEYEQSFNTYTDYTHYQFEFPNDMSRITKSGNYVLYVYEDDQEDNLVISRRFIVYEDLILIDGDINASSKVSEQRYNQEIDVKVFHPDFEISDPYNEFSLTILQNNRWDNAIMGLSPRFVKNNELDFDYSDENNFWAGNEFRTFENKNFGFVSSQVYKSGILNEEWHTILMPDQRRAFKVYSTSYDLDGKFFIRNDNAIEPFVEEEYAWVHFTFPFDSDLGKNKIYVFGELSDFQYKEEFVMKYNDEKKAYESLIQLKQGYYNYLYLAKFDHEEFGSPEYTEGSHFEAQNKYTIIAYNQDFFDGYDRVVGILSVGVNR